MAILSSLPGISVTVHNEQGQLPEYADAEPDPVKNLESSSSVVVSNYIEAPSDGGPFWLKFGVKAPYMHSPHIILFRYDINGTDRNGDHCGPLNMKNKQSWEREYKGYNHTDDRGRVFRSFQFTKLKILQSDDQSLGVSETKESKAASSGVFEVRVLLGRLQKNVATKVAKRPKKAAVPKSKQPKQQLLNKSSEIPSTSTKSNTPATATTTEKIAAKKSLSLGLTYKEKPLEASSGMGKRYTYINGWNNPIAVFQFKYRSKVDLQRLLLIEKTPEPEHLPEENLFPVLPMTPVAVKQESEQGQQTHGQQISQPVQPASGELSAVATPSQCTEQKNNHVVKGSQHPPAAVNSAAPLYPSPLAPISKAFDELKFTEVRDLARKQHKCFDDLNGDEVENFARQKLAEGVVDTDGSSASHTSRAFDDLTFSEVWDFARKNYKDFNELNRREIEELARQGYSQAMSSSQAAISGPAEEPNVQGKRKAHVKQEDTDEDVVFVSAAKVAKRQKCLRNTEIAVKEEL